MSYYADSGITILIYVTLAVSLNLLLGYTGRVSMAHAVFFGIGGFTAARLALPRATGGGTSSSALQSGAGWPWVAAVAAAVAVSFLAALVISLPAVRLVRGEYLILLTLAFQLIANDLMQVLDSVTGGPYGLSGVPPINIFGAELTSPTQMFWVMLVAAILAFTICSMVGRSPLGRLMKGIREYDSAVASFGKNPVIPELLAFGISAAIAGGIGGLAGFYYGSVVPGNYTLNLSILMVSVVVLGGVGNMAGTVVGAVVLGALDPLLRQFVGDSAIPWQAVIYGAALIAIVRLRPAGLIPEGTTLWKRRGKHKHPGLSDNGRPTVDDSPSVNHGEPQEGLPPLVEVVDLHKAFGGLAAVNGATFALTRGQITALIGPNGAGKTTIFNMICGSTRPDRGRVLVRGRNVVGRAPYVVARLGVARSFQDVRLCLRLSAIDNVAMAVPDQPGEHVGRLLARPLSSRRREKEVQSRAMECLALLGVADEADTRVADLSYGDQKLVAIARLVATDCEVLLLDEPTSGVDPGSLERVIAGIARLRSLGRTICLVEHSVHFVRRLADRAVFLDQGAVIAEGPVDDLISRRELAELYFGT